MKNVPFHFIFALLFQQTYIHANVLPVQVSIIERNTNCGDIFFSRQVEYLNRWIYNKYADLSKFSRGSIHTAERLQWKLAPSHWVSWWLIHKAVSETTNQWIESVNRERESVATLLFFGIHYRISLSTITFEFRTISVSVSPLIFLQRIEII